MGLPSKVKYFAEAGNMSLMRLLGEQCEESLSLESIIFNAREV